MERSIPIKYCSPPKLKYAAIMSPHSASMHQEVMEANPVIAQKYQGDVSQFAAAIAALRSNGQGRYRLNGGDKGEAYLFGYLSLVVPNSIPDYFEKAFATSNETEPSSVADNTEPDTSCIESA